MNASHEFYHGADGDSILGILNSGSMRPGTLNKVYFSERRDDTFQHGGDRRRRATFSVKVRVTLPPGASLTRQRTQGNALAVIVTTTMPIPATVLELYSRTLQPLEIKTIVGIDAIRAHLLRA
jgi:hypothetical protein